MGSLKVFLEFRHCNFGRSEALPLFIHEDGSNYSKDELNRDLKTMLEEFPELSTSNKDSWSGHSFRSGISTLLQTLGFSGEKIQVITI